MDLNEKLEKELERGIDSLKLISVDSKEYALATGSMVKLYKLKLDEDRSKMDEERLKLEANRVKIDEERSKMDGERLKLDESRIKIDEERLKLDEKTNEERLKLDESRVKIDEDRVEIDKSRVKIDEDRVEIDKSQSKMDGERLKLEADKEQNNCQNRIKDRLVQIGLGAAEIVVPAVLYWILMNKGFRFEETGTITSTFFRGLISKSRPDKI